MEVTSDIGPIGHVFGQVVVLLSSADKRQCMMSLLILLVQSAPSVSFFSASDSPASPEQDVPTIPTTVPNTSLSPTTTNSFQTLNPNCGDCFCIPDPDCLAPQPGLSDSFPDYVSSIYASFVATNSIPLQADDGGNCYPFADALQGILSSTAYNETALPQCQKPNSTDGYCAFVFEDSNTNFSNYSECEGRRYALETFEVEAAVPPTASITHKGRCGVCSSAQDFAARTSSQGFTEACATLWSHLTATNGELCANECLGGLYQLNGDPPDCAPGECIVCGQPFQQAFDDISGRTPWNSGFTELPAHSCSMFYPVVHDPCPVRQDQTPAPVPKTSDASSWETSAAMSMILLLIQL